MSNYRPLPAYVWQHAWTNGNAVARLRVGKVVKLHGVDRPAMLVHIDLHLHRTSTMQLKAWGVDRQRGGVDHGCLCHGRCPIGTHKPDKALVT